MRNALVYVLDNARKHRQVMREMDLCSSAPWFTDWAWRPPTGWPCRVEAPVVSAQTWLLQKGWRKWGPIAPDQAPRPPG